MFKKIFIDLCNKNNEAPSIVCMKLGLSSSAFSKWNDESVPRRATLQRIADYFGVDVSYLTGNITPITVTQHNATGETQAEQTEPLTEQEKTILRLFRETTEEGRMRMIQSIFNIHDSINKSKASGGISSLA